MIVAVFKIGEVLLKDRLGPDETRARGGGEAEVVLLESLASAFDGHAFIIIFVEVLFGAANCGLTHILLKILDGGSR